MRKQLLNTALNTENNLNQLIQEIDKKDKKFLQRKLTALQNEYDDAEESLEQRLSEEAVIDDSVVEVLYGNLVAISEKKGLYESFKKYLSDKNQTEQKAESF